MTWTNIHPEFGQYEGLTPEGVGFLLANMERRQTIETLRKDYSLFQQFGSNPLDIHIDNDDWNDFWEPSYALKDKDVETWDEDDFYMYIALDWLVNFAILAGLAR
jgi:hypothetical protein